MKIGLISDTHNKTQNILRALKVFNENKVDLILHAGDWSKLETFEFFKNEIEKYKIPFKTVLGNNDSDFILEKSLKFEIDGKKIAICHGDDKNLLEKLILENDVVIHGHSHKLRNEFIGSTLVLNPGSTSFNIPRQKDFRGTIGIYDSIKNECEFIEL